MGIFFGGQLASDSRSAQDSLVVEADLFEWRQKATHILLVACVIVYLPGIVLHLTTKDAKLAWPVNLCAVLAYVTTVIGALLHGVDHRIKMRVVISAGFLLAIIGSAASPQDPFFQSTPLCMAILALALIGARAGRIATVIGATVTLLAPFLHIAFPRVASALVVGPAHAPIPTGVILTQGVVLTGALVCVMVILDRYHSFMVRTLASRHKAAARLEHEVGECTIAHQDLHLEMEERRRLEREIARVSDDERRRFGQDVHDGVCQQLTGALLRCQALERRLGRGQDLALEDLCALSALLEEAIDEAHAVAKGLCPLDPDSGALSSALRTLAKRTHGATGVQCHFVSTGDVSVPDPTTAQHLYRIAQEALSNASRHAQANQVVVELERCDEELLLRVEDDGAGLPAKLPSGGMGLRTMAYRVHILEGQITVGPGSNGGTSVACRVPRILHSTSGSPTSKEPSGDL